MDTGLRCELQVLCAYEPSTPSAGKSQDAHSHWQAPIGMLTFYKNSQRNKTLTVEFQASHEERNLGSVAAGPNPQCHCPIGPELWSSPSLPPAAFLSCGLCSSTGKGEESTLLQEATSGPIAVARQQEEGLGENSIHFEIYLKEEKSVQRLAAGAQGKLFPTPLTPPPLFLLPPSPSSHMSPTTSHNYDLNSNFYQNTMGTMSRMN